VYPEAYLEGIRLFNDEHFWHSHEQWEECWHESSLPHDDLFYKGIIQAAAALVHWQKGNPRGLHKNWAKSHSKLEQVPSPYMGLDVIAFMAAMQAFVTACDNHAPAPFPRIVLLDTAART
jgi:hypothetical protein